MIKHLQKVGDRRGIIIDKSLLDSLNVGENGAFRVTIQEGGLFLKPVRPMEAYQKVSRRHRKSLDKLAK